MDTKTYGGHTVAALREFIAYSEENGKSIDDITGDDASSAEIIRDLLAAVSSDAAGAPLAWKHRDNHTVISDKQKRNAAEHNGLPGKRLAGNFSIPLYAAPVAPAAQEKPFGAADRVNLDGWQLLEALNYLAPDRDTDPEQLNGDVMIQFGCGHSGEALYCWNSEYPDDGAFVLDGSTVDRNAFRIVAPAAVAPNEANRLDTVELILRDVCEDEPADPEKNDTVCIDISDLKVILDRHIASGASRESVLEWAVGRWNAEVANRPLVNVHRQSLDGTWRQVIRYLGGDDSSLLGLRHSELIASAPTPTVAADAAAPSEDAYVAQRMTETLAEVYATIIGDDARPEDESLNAIERVTKAAQVPRLEVDLYRAHSEELATTKQLFLAAAADLGAINEALGLDPEDGGAEPILDAIAELKRERDQWVDANYVAPAAVAPSEREARAMRLLEIAEPILEHAACGDRVTMAASDLLRQVRVFLPANAAPTPTVAADAAAPTQVGKNALVLTGAQLLEALDFIAPDRATDPEQLEATVAIEFGEGHGGKAMYVWCAEYPEEGSFVLDGKPASGELMPINAPALQPAERAAFDYDDVVRICDAHGIGLPIDCVEMVVEIVRRAASQGAKQ